MSEASNLMSKSNCNLMFGMSGIRGGRVLEKEVEGASCGIVVGPLCWGNMIGLLCATLGFST
jgi:hypothetical protein